MVQEATDSQRSWGRFPHDVGTFTFAPDGEVLADHGPKMLFDRDIGALGGALAGGS